VRITGWAPAWIGSRADSERPADRLIRMVASTSEPSPGITRTVVLPWQAGERLDRYLATATPLSRRQARRLVAEGRVCRNGRVVRVQSRTVELADVIDLLRAPEEVGVPPLPPLPELPVVLDDGWLVVVDKPAGMLSQPAARRRPGELAADQLLALRLAAERGAPPFLRLVHRLDRVTSGLLLFARRPDALPELARYWREGKVRRGYLAVVTGTPGWEAERVNAPIARDPGGGWRFVVAARGRPATTDVRVLRRGPEHAVVACTLVTGRTHQVRVHLAHLGHPVLGDRLYGGPPGPSRPLLHALSLALPHPEDGREVEVSAPPPDDLAPFLEEATTGRVG
jgi:23S rRNA pseudouridine1911/1915/1917 synthase